MTSRFVENVSADRRKKPVNPLPLERRRRFWQQSLKANRKLTRKHRCFRHCGRHDYGTRVLQGTGNLAVVMRAMGHGSPSTAMKYQHPELEQVRRVLNGTNSRLDPEQGLNGTFYDTVTKQ
jgi:integrase